MSATGSADPKISPTASRSIADYAHRRGLKFGLWMDWTQAGTQRTGALNVFDPGVRAWLIAEPPAGWKHREPFKGITIDIGVPAVQDVGGAELERVVHDYHLDMLEHDGYLVAQGCIAAIIRRAARILAPRSNTKTPASLGRRLERHGHQLPCDARLLRDLRETCVASIHACCWRSATMAAGWWISAAPRTATTSPSPMVMIRSRTGARSTMQLCVATGHAGKLRGEVASH